MRRRVPAGGGPGGGAGAMGAVLVPDSYGQLIGQGEGDLPSHLEHDKSIPMLTRHRDLRGKSLLA
jgi:hypothetical protein